MTKINGDALDLALMQSHLRMHTLSLLNGLIKAYPLHWIVNNLWLLPAAALYYLAIR